MAALVAVDPKNGRVLAYYGGDNGTGTDYAGKNTDDGRRRSPAVHPPGSSFKIYTLAAALEAGISLESRWDATPFKPEGTKYKISNAGRDDPQVRQRRCTLEESTVQSLQRAVLLGHREIGRTRSSTWPSKAGVSTMWRRRRPGAGATT